ncbi:MAG: hypothetical protein GWN30_18275, partial [Gammaproteobacteria bacterium]|nr:hypothetical protein [Gammaproteobacteria bacterium]
PGASDFDVKSILSGDQSTNWEVYFDNGAASTDPNDYLVKYDGTSTFRFSVGKAFWVIHQGNVSINEVVDAASLNSSGVVNIPLHQGWNLITNPFAIPVNWAVIQGANQIGNPIYRYNWSG